MTDPDPRTAEGQAALNQAIAEHDQTARESGDDGQQFEISSGGGK